MKGPIKLEYWTFKISLQNSIFEHIRVYTDVITDIYNNVSFTIKIMENRTIKPLKVQLSCRDPFYVVTVAQKLNQDIPITVKQFKIRGQYFTNNR